MPKNNKTPIGIFIESSGLYFSNFDKFIKYMSFPVLGQIFGLGLIFGITLLCTQNLPKLIEHYPNLNNIKTLLLIVLTAILPGLLIYLKAFWEYLVSYGAINSMLDNMIKSGRVYDFEAHNELITRRSASFVGLWLLIGIFSIISFIPFFWVIGGIFAVYFVLAFQVFTFEPDQTPFGCLKRSLKLVLRHFGSTFLLITLAGGLTYFVIPQIVVKAFDTIGVVSLLANFVKPLFASLPVIEIPNYGVITDFQLGSIVVQSIISQILIQYTLPMRSILWAMWYKELNNNSSSQIKKEKKSTKKRPSEKLMEESHKKYGKKKLDTNILKRASQKDE